ncbi:hypothetical protein EDC39_107169 [Geothermobacter ehrlichii]|uniref:Uncharacterized protein n=1 Tax=Geothermobacter ehrlichii TaxID=213224 RepID=A0A5D3WJK9_9BACT|nr:hypothetical protein EDC39_107169 [Geothermobacter ehrlichii]
MYLAVCSDCQYGGEKDGKSHCGKESVYSYLTRCIQVEYTWSGKGTQRGWLRRFERRIWG